MSKLKIASIIVFTVLGGIVGYGIGELILSATNYIRFEDIMKARVVLPILTAVLFYWIGLTIISK